MRDHLLSAAMGIALAAALLPATATNAQASDPTGYWRKADQGKYPAKMQIYRCGGRSICVKIAWLQNPHDSQGRMLQDVRNVNPSLRGRTIEGLPIVSGMGQVGANQWKGSIYNPEDGKTYSATVTLASSSKIVLKGCVAAFLCREQVWLRTSAPPPREEEKPEPEVEASAEPAAPPAESAAAAAAAAVVPAAATASATTTTGSATTTTGSSVANAEVLAPAGKPGVGQPGYRYLQPSAAKQPGFTGESVSSMFSMASPLESANAKTVTRAAPPPPAAPRAAAVAPKPVAPPQATATAAPASQSAPAAPPAPRYAPAPQSEPADAYEADPASPESAGTAYETETAEAEDEAGRKLSWRERRQMRRQKRMKELQAQGQNLIPWMR